MHSVGIAPLFCFPNANDWVMAAHAINNVIQPLIVSQDTLNSHERLLEIPVYMWPPKEHRVDAEFYGLLELAIGRTSPEDLFWSLGMEIGLILMRKDYCLTNLYSDSCDQMTISVLTAFVYTCTRALLSDHIDHGGVVLDMKKQGGQSLRHAIQHITERVGNPDDNRITLGSQLKAAAKAAQEDEGIELAGNKEFDNQEVTLKIRQLEDLVEWLNQFDQVQEWRHQGELKKEQEELRSILANKPVDLLLEELVENVTKIQSQPLWLKDPYSLKASHVLLLLSLRPLTVMMVAMLANLAGFLLVVALLLWTVALMLDTVSLNAAAHLVREFMLNMALKITGWKGLQLRLRLCSQILILQPQQVLSHMRSSLATRSASLIYPLPGIVLALLVILQVLGNRLSPFLQLIWLDLLWFVPQWLKLLPPYTWDSEHGWQPDTFELQLEKLQLLEKHLWHWLQWDNQPPLWWREERLRSWLALEQLIINKVQALDDTWQNLQEDEFETEELLFMALEQRLQSIQTQLADLQASLAANQEQV
jgi:hypothetical protein